MTTAPTDSPRRHLRLSYQPALDGLRAVAVVAVMLYHGGVSWMPGGFLGVDLFFVLSGFLITSLLAREFRATSRIDLASFYLRRAARLLPAVLALLVFLAAYLVLVDPSTQRRLPGDALSALGYVTNWRLLLHGDSYFDQFSEPSMLRHFWSLAIEEQWYIVWPVALWILFLRRANPIAVVVGLAVGSALLGVALEHAGASPGRLYYGTDVRAQALLAGAALALLQTDRDLTGPRSSWPGVLGLGGLAALFLTVSDRSDFLYRGGLTAAALVAVVTVWGAIGDHRLGRALGVRWLRMIGRLSYGMYLWHWPLFVLMTPRRTGLSGPALLAARFSLTIALAAISLVMIERPIRLAASRPRAFTAGAVAAAVMASAAFLALYIRTANAPPGPLAASSQVGASARSEPDHEPAEITVLLLGDSVGTTLGSYYRSEWSGARVRVDLQTQIGCGIVVGEPILGGRPSPQPSECRAWSDRWLDGLSTTRPDIAVVELGAWEVVDHKVDGQTLRVGTDEYARYLTAQLRRGVALIREAGVTPLIMGVPCFMEESRELQSTSTERSDPSRTAWVDRVFRSLAAEERVAYFDLAAVLCGPERQAGWRSDGVHLTERGSERVWRALVPVFDALL